LTLKFKTEAEMNEWLAKTKRADNKPAAKSTAVDQLLQESELELEPKRDLNYRPPLPPRAVKPKRNGTPLATIVGKTVIWTVFVAFQVWWWLYVTASAGTVWDAEVWITWGFGATGGASFVMVVTNLVVAMVASSIPHRY
jgi:hypothetical protein